MLTETNLYKSGKTENVILRWLLPQHQSTRVAFDDDKPFHIVSCERKRHPLQDSCLENPMDGGAWRLQCVGLQRVRHNRSDSAQHIWKERKWSDRRLDQMIQVLIKVFAPMTYFSRDWKDWLCNCDVIVNSLYSWFLEYCRYFLVVNRGLGPKGSPMPRTAVTKYWQLTMLPKSHECILPSYDNERKRERLMLRRHPCPSHSPTVMILRDDMKTDFPLPVLPTMVRQDGMILRTKFWTLAPLFLKLRPNLFFLPLLMTGEH